MDLRFLWTQTQIHPYQERVQRDRVEKERVEQAHVEALGILRAEGVFVCVRTRVFVRACVRSISPVDPLGQSACLAVCLSVVRVRVGVRVRVRSSSPFR